jgi:glycosyltransferase involved in cell wall biosynthesis
MAYGVPVVTTWEGVEGIDCQNGRECWVSETDEELAGKVCRLLESPIERKQMRDAARILIEESYSPRPVVDKMIEVYHQLIGTSEARPHASLCI